MWAIIKIFIVFLIILAGMIGALWYLRPRVPIVAEFVAFLVEHKLWWITPIAIFVAFIIVLIVITQTSGGGAGFVYTFF